MSQRAAFKDYEVEIVCAALEAFEWKPNPEFVARVRRALEVAPEVEVADTELVGYFCSTCERTLTCTGENKAFHGDGTPKCNGAYAVAYRVRTR